MHNLWKSNMERIDFIESRTELRGCWFWEFGDWATTWAHVCGGPDEECSVLSSGKQACWGRNGGSVG